MCSLLVAPRLCAYTRLVDRRRGPCWVLSQRAASPDPKLSMKEETGPCWGAGRERPVLQGLSADSGSSCHSDSDAQAARPGRVMAAKQQFSG